MKVMNIKTKLVLGIGMLAGMIILLVTLSVVNLQILRASFIVDFYHWGYLYIYWIGFVVLATT